MAFFEVGNGGENGECDEITEDAKHKLVDTDINRSFGDYMVSPITQLHNDQSTVSCRFILQ